MSTISGIEPVSGSLTTYNHQISGNLAPELTVYQEMSKNVKLASSDEAGENTIWVKNTGQTPLTKVWVVVTIQGGNGIWSGTFCDSEGNVIDNETQNFSFGTVDPNEESQKLSYKWKSSKPNVDVDGNDFKMHFTAIPTFTVAYNDKDEFFQDSISVEI